MTSVSAVRSIALGVMICLATPAFADDQSESPSETTETTQAEATATASTTQTAQAAPAEPEEITDRNHPDYLRCRSERVIGSLAQRRRICMTNRQWRAAAEQGNRVATELVTEMRANASNGN